MRILAILMPFALLSVCERGHGEETQFENRIVIPWPESLSPVAPVLLDSKGDTLAVPTQEFSKTDFENRGKVPTIQEFVCVPDDLKKAAYILLFENALGIGACHVGLCPMKDVTWNKDGKFSLDLDKQALPLRVEFGKDVRMPADIEKESHQSRLNRLIAVVVRETGVKEIPYIVSWTALLQDAKSESDHVYVGSLEYPPKRGILLFGEQEKLVKVSEEIRRRSPGIQPKDLEQLTEQILSAKFETKKDKDGKIVPSVLEIQGNMPPPSNDTSVKPGRIRLLSDAELEAERSTTRSKKANKSP